MIPHCDDNEFVVMDPDPLRRMELGLRDIRAGRMVILVDDEDRENEGDLVMAAEKVTPEAINFMATNGRGLICLSMTESQVGRLALPMMSSNNLSPFGTAFTVSIEAREGVSTGISAHDRARTIKVAIDPDARPEHLVTPGHVFPLRARDAGVLVRAGQTEGSVDMARLAGLNPAGVICEVMNDDGTMARMPDLERFAATHRIRIVTVADIIRWRLRFEKRVESVITVRMPVAGLGDFQVQVYRSTTNEGLHMALTRGDLTGEPPPLVRVQSGCPAGDIFDSLACDCGSQLHLALQAIASEGRGALVYMNINGNSSEQMLERLRAHLLPPEQEWADPPGQSEEPELRQFGTGAQILIDLGIREMRLLTNNPRKIVGLEGYGLRVAERVPIEIPPNSRNRAFLHLRRSRFGHLLKDLEPENIAGQQEAKGSFQEDSHTA